MQAIRLIICSACLFISFGMQAQKTAISGKVTDGDTGEPMPFVNVYYLGTTIGTTTDFDGYYTLETDKPGDSLAASYIGYLARTKYVEKGKNQTINFQLSPDAVALQGVDIVYGEYENPAWEIMRNVVKNKKRNDKRSLDAYEYESYSKVELDVDNISEKFRKKKVVQKIVGALDSMQRVAGDDGKPILPIFISETISQNYFVNNPEKNRENIIKTKLTGIALEDGSLTSQIIGSSFQIYNLYQNWISIVEKDFISPIADSWKAFYEYELVEENEDINGFKCYRITFKPKRPEDLAFNGTMWITDSTNHYALKQIELKIGKEANLNFIEKVQLQQTLEPVDSTGAWLPSKSRILIDIGEIRDDWAGMLAKFYVSNHKFVANQPKEPVFYEERVKVDEGAMETTDEYWLTHRHDSLTATEQHMYAMIDTIRNLPVVRSYVEFAEIAFNGYKTVGKFDLGTYTHLYAFNDVEGNRFRLGFKSNHTFSKHIVLSGYGAYGTRDQRFKYKAELNYIANRKHWLIFGGQLYRDIDQVGIYNDHFSNSPLFVASTRFGTLRRPFLHNISQAWVSGDIIRGLRQSVRLRQRQFTPVGDSYDFYYKLPGEPNTLKQDFKVTELIFETRIAFKEKFILYDNERVSLGTDGRPEIILRALFGLDAFNSDFKYHKFSASITQDIRMGLFGRLNYRITGGYVPQAVPYPLLEAHLGNQSIFFNENSFNMMDFFEFVSDTYGAIKLKHSFDGLILNRIPLMRKLKWRSFVTANALYGSVRQENIDILPSLDPSGNPIVPYPQFRALGDKPYMEVGYGIENILRFIRVDFIHRLSYLNQGANAFGIKMSFQFKL